MSNHRLLGAVLCGGGSKRMGRDKATLVDAAGLSFLQATVERLQVCCDQVCLSVAASQHDELAARLGLARVVDRVDQQGPAVGLAAALAYAIEHEFAACFVNPVDMPNLTAAELTTLRDCWRSSPNRIVTAIDAENGQRQPLVAIYPIDQQKLLQELADSKQRSLFRWLAQRACLDVALPSATLSNINRPEDLHGG